MNSRSFFLLFMGAVLGVTLGSLGCDREILLGDLGKSGGMGGTGPEPHELPTTLVFSSGFEPGNFSEWNESGSSLTRAGGTLSIGTTSHEGGQAALFSTEITGEHVVISTGGDWTEILVGFWILFEAHYASPNWPILHIDSQTEAGTVELWDLGIDSSVDALHRLFLWQKPAVSDSGEEAQVGSAAEGFSVGEWTHIQLHLLASTGGDGFIVVYQNGRSVIEIANRPTGTGDPLVLGFGSFAYNLEPLPAHFWIDDVTIHVP
jgi:hypothetical protein